MASLGPKDKEVGLDNNFVEDTEPFENEKFDRNH